MNDKSSSSDEDNKKNNSLNISSNNNEKSSKSNNEEEEEEEQLINYYTYINDCSTKIEEDRQNYFNKLSELKSQIEEIKTKSITSIDYAMLIITEFTTFCDSFYSSFSEQKKILEKFTELNDSAQNINFCYEKANYSNLYFKESNKKLTKQYEKLIKENKKLHQIIKELKSNMNNKNNKENDLIEIKNQNEIKNKMEKVMEENIQLKKRCSQILTESKIIKDYADEKFITEQENQKRMSTLLNKIDLYEDKIGQMQKQIKQYEIERINTESKEIENKTFNNINNNRYENENTINLDINKSELSDNISLKQGINLEELLENQNDLEEEEKVNKSINININNEQKNKESNKKTEKNNSDYSSKSIKRYNDYDIDADNETSPNFLMFCPMKKPGKTKKTHERSNNLRIYKSPFSIISPSKSQSSIAKNKKNKNARSEINGGKSFEKNYYKIFFFLLLKSIIINRNIKEFFKKNDFDTLFEECTKRRIPFNKYEDWIVDKFKLDGDKNEKILYDGIINDCFICSSFI